MTKKAIWHVGSVATAPSHALWAGTPPLHAPSVAAAARIVAVSVQLMLNGWSASWDAQPHVSVPPP